MAARRSWPPSSRWPGWGRRRRVLPERLGARDPRLHAHRGDPRPRHRCATAPAGLELAFLGGLTLLAGWAASPSFWSPGAAAPVLEAERGILYVAATAAALLLLSTREASAALLGGIVAGAVLVSLYASAPGSSPVTLAERTTPRAAISWPSRSATGTPRLLAAIAILLAIGFATHGHLRDTEPRRGRESSSFSPRSTSFSRGAPRGARRRRVMQVALDPRRARLLSLGSWSPCRRARGAGGLGVPRTRTAAGATLQTAQAEGSHLTRRLLVLALVAAAAPVVLFSSSGGYGCRSGPAPSSSPRPFWPLVS